MNIKISEFDRTNKKRIKGFIRFLKELGLFNEWVRQRKSHIKRYNLNKSGKKDYIFECIYSYGYLAAVINDAFNWSESGMESMWDNLYELADSYGIRSQEAPYCKGFMEEAKEIVKKYID